MTGRCFSKLENGSATFPSKLKLTLTKTQTLCHHVDFNSVSIAENGYFSRDIYSVQLEKIIGLS